MLSVCLGMPGVCPCRTTRRCADGADGFLLNCEIPRHAKFDAKIFSTRRAEKLPAHAYDNLDAKRFVEFEFNSGAGFQPAVLLQLLQAGSLPTMARVRITRAHRRKRGKLTHFDRNSGVDFIAPACRCWKLFRADITTRIGLMIISTRLSKFFATEKFSDCDMKKDGALRRERFRRPIGQKNSARN